MRHGRLKAARKTLDFFRLASGITPPYNVLLDGTFLVAIISQKLPLHERLDRLLQRKRFIINITRSTLDELKTLMEKIPEKKELFRQSRQWGLDHCDNILEECDIPTDEEKYDDDNLLSKAGKEMISIIRAQATYFVCSQDEKVLSIVRFMGTSPVMRISRGILLLENPSKASTRMVNRQERKKWSVAGSIQEQETKLIDCAKETQKKKYQQQQQQYTPPSYNNNNGRYHKAKGPNPLSCKKKKRDDDVTTDTKKRKRRRKGEKVVES